MDAEVKPMKSTIIVLISAVIMTHPLSHASAVDDNVNAVDHKLFDELLKKHVAYGVVDYGGFKKEEAVLDDYLRMMETVEVDDLSRNEQYAFYINLYNAWTIQLILTGYPGVESIKDMGSLFRKPWDKKIVRLKKGIVTLDYVEHEVLRPVFKDPRVHFAINCAAKSCPPLRSEAYRGDILEEQLDDSTISFLNDPRENFLKGETLYISKIFDWFEEDFNGVKNFFLKYARGDLKRQLESLGDRLETDHLKYDWSLNGR